MRKRYGYIRVSAKEQNPERQYVALQEQGIGKKDIFLDKISGKDFERKNYQIMKKRLTSNDLVVIKSIDRLGRNYDKIIEAFNRTTRNKDIYALEFFDRKVKHKHVLIKIMHKKAASFCTK